VRAAGFATQYFCFGNATTTATFARDSVTQKDFQYGENETTRRVADRAQKGLAGNLCFEIAALSNLDGRTRGPVGGCSASKVGGGVRLADNRIRSSNQTGCDADSKSSLCTCDGTAGAQRFQGRLCCGAERISSTESGGICARTVDSDSHCRNETGSQAHCRSETFCRRDHRIKRCR